MNDDCRDCALLVTANPAAARLQGLHALLHEDAEDEPLGLCEWGGESSSCSRDADDRFPAGEALCTAHAVVLYGA